MSEWCERTVLHLLGPVDEFVDHADDIGGWCDARNVNLIGGGGMDVNMTFERAFFFAYGNMDGMRV